MRRLAVTPGPAHGLHVALEARGQPQVQHGPHVRPVQPHPEGHRGHHHPQPAVHEGLLHPPPLPATHAGVVGFGYSLGGPACGEDTDGWVDCVPEAAPVGHDPADLTSGPQVPGRRQAGAEQCGDTLCVLASVAVHDDGAQSTETITPQQRHQSLVGDGGQWGLSEAVPLPWPRCAHLPGLGPCPWTQRGAGWWGW